MRMKLYISPSKIRLKLLIVIANMYWVLTMCQALCCVLSPHYLTDSSQLNEGGTKKLDSGKLRNLSIITQHSQDWECLTPNLRLRITWLQELEVLIKSKDPSYSSTF